MEQMYFNRCRYSRGLAAASSWKLATSDAWSPSRAARSAEPHWWPEILRFLSGRLLGAGHAGYARRVCKNLIRMLKQEEPH